MTKKGKVTTLVTIGERTLLFDIENKCSLITSVTIRTLISGDTCSSIVCSRCCHFITCFQDR